MVDSTNRLEGARATFGSKKPVAAASTGDIPTLSGFQTIDGVSFSSTSDNLRVLVKDQAAAEQNGIYEQSSSSWTRTKDFDGNTDFVKGTPVHVARGGTVNGGRVFQVSSNNPPNVGIDPITFVELLNSATEDNEGALDKASDEEIRAATSGAHAICAEDLESANAFVDLTDAATVAIDWKIGFNFALTLTASRALGVPTNGIPGTFRTVYVVSDGGPDTLTLTGYGGDLPTLDDITTTKAYLLTIFCRTSTQFLLTAINGSPV